MLQPVRRQERESERERERDRERERETEREREREGEGKMLGGLPGCLDVVFIFDVTKKAGRGYAWGFGVEASFRGFTVHRVPVWAGSSSDSFFSCGRIAKLGQRKSSDCLSMGESADVCLELFVL